MGRSVRAGVRRLAASPMVGPLLCWGLSHLGAPRIARRLEVARGKRPPDVCSEDLPRDLFATPHVSMLTSAGRDQVAMHLWTRGWNSYEAPFPAYFSATVTNGDTVLDIGANTGYYSMLAASVGPDVEVHAFEPLATVADILDANLGLNDQGKQVRVVRMAVDEETGSAELFLPLAHHGLVETSASLAAGFRAEHSAAVTVHTTTLDEYAHLNALARVDVIKIDVEGLEDRVLRGARTTLARCRPVVFIEVLDCDDWTADVDAINRIRSEAGYVSVRMTRESAICELAVIHDPMALNQALWPEERLDHLQRVCDRLGQRLYLQLAGGPTR